MRRRKGLMRMHGPRRFALKVERGKYVAREGAVSYTHLTDLKAVFTGLLEKMADGDSELITIYYGENADKDQAEELEALCTGTFENCDVEVHYGGQPVYPLSLIHISTRVWRDRFFKKRKRDS